MMWSVEFRSDRFLPVLPEECQVNPGAYGFELAWWLAVELARRGIVTSYPEFEDWGWYLEWQDAGSEYMIACASTAQEAEGYRGEAIEWRIHLDRHKRLSERWRGAPDESGSRRLSEAIENVLREAGITIQG